MRLERKFYIKDTWVKAFQFHKGTIRTEDFDYLTIELTEFQFHKGTIRTVNFGGAIDLLKAFQFHKGTIRTLATFEEDT